MSKDEGVRPTTLEKLLKLKPAFKEGGSTTAGKYLPGTHALMLNLYMYYMCTNVY